MTEKIIQNILWRHLSSKGHTLICPNYTPAKWWECDMFSVTKSGYVVEHEIKISKADFKNDTKKSQNTNVKTEIRNKHIQLASSDPDGPNRFFYVVPEDLIKKDEVPTWAGLMYVNKYGSVYVEKDAPKLHKTKLDEKVKDHVTGVFYWRFWNERNRKLT